MAWLRIIRILWDRSLAAGAAVVGAVFIVLGWVGVHDKVYVAQQIPYIVSGGLGGLFLLGVAATLWISADLRDEWRKLDAMQQEWEAQATAPAPQSAASNGTAPSTPATTNGHRPLRARLESTSPV